jgi:hypothetical protein
MSGINHDQFTTIEIGTFPYDLQVNKNLLIIPLF